MASKRFEKGTTEFQWFGDFWSMVQQYWIPEDKDEYWESLIAAISEFSNKYKQEPEIVLFTTYMIKAVQDFLTSKMKYMKGDLRQNSRMISERDVGRLVANDSVWNMFVTAMMAQVAE